jgi:small-conductance mechanosensitive channel
VADRAHDVLPVLGSSVAAAVVAWVTAVLVGRAASGAGRRAGDPVWVSLQKRCRWPFRLALMVAAIMVVLPDSTPDRRWAEAVSHAFTVLLIGSVSWLLVQLSAVVEDVAAVRMPSDVGDNRHARRLRTQIVVLRRVLVAIVIFVAIAAALMTFPRGRTLGASFLASAGVLGIVAGLAAQTTLGNLIAGLQIAFTDPIRIDDVVVVDGEWGRIDEITLTYVVVRTWDNRRLILPVSWFTQNVFQNWTRHESRVLGNVILHVDFSVPVERLRAEMQRLVEASPLWDRRDWVLQVVDTTPTTMVLRGLMSSADAPSNWDLRCEVREQLLDFLQRNYPESLPRLRTEVERLPASPAPESGVTRRPGRFMHPGEGGNAAETTMRNAAEHD